MKVAHANAPLECAADRCVFGYFDSDALCATPTAERRQVKSGRSKHIGNIANDKAKTQTYCQILVTRSITTT
jgi:hypothetical protein